jgi:hypothetical protein
MDLKSLKMQGKANCGTILHEYVSFKKDFFKLVSLSQMLENVGR